MPPAIDPGNYFKGKRVLVTGGLGFIGSNLARRLVKCGAEVTLLDNLMPEYGGNRRNIRGIDSRVKVVIADVRDKVGLPALVRDRDVLFNLAGQSSHLDSIRDPDTDLEINCRAQLSILESCREHNPAIRVVFAGTRQVYGRPDYLPVDEKHPIRPVDVNGINKCAGEWYHLLYHKVHGLATCVLRLTNTIGPRMRIKDARQTFVGVWVRNLIEGKPLEVWGGHQLRDFTYVDDCVEALLLAASRPEAEGRVFNLGGTKPVTLRALAELMVEAHGSGEFRVKRFPANRRKIDIGDYYADDTLIRETLGWKPKVTLPVAIKRTLAYYQRELDHYL